MNRVQELNSYLIIRKKGKLLLLKRFNGIWEFPGGGIEFGEHPKDAAIREANEETGLSIKGKIRLLGATSARFESNGREKHAVYFVYLATSFSGKLRISAEHTEYKWCSVAVARKLKLGLNVRPAFVLL